MAEAPIVLMNVHAIAYQNGDTAKWMSVFIKRMLTKETAPKIEAAKQQITPISLSLASS